MSRGFLWGVNENAVNQSRWDRYTTRLDGDKIDGKGRPRKKDRKVLKDIPLEKRLEDVMDKAVGGFAIGKPITFLCPCGVEVVRRKKPVGQVRCIECKMRRNRERHKEKKGHIL